MKVISESFLTVPVPELQYNSSPAATSLLSHFAKYGFIYSVYLCIGSIMLRGRCIRQGGITARKRTVHEVSCGDEVEETWCRDHPGLFMIQRVCLEFPCKH